jgi:uncharacterized repeat protein (TIGR02543 family)
LDTVCRLFSLIIDSDDIKPIMKSLHHPAKLLALFFVFAIIATSAFATPPDLTQPGVIAGINRSETYNLGATGMRGWIALTGGGDTGLITDQSRQILVTHCVAPANAVLAVDDVILGAMAASSGTVPDFTSDCRKAFATAIADAEKTGAGTLRVKRWRAGVVTNQNISLPILGNYSNTAPFTCPKSTAILNNVRNKVVADLIADPNYLQTGFGGACSGLALLSGVKPGDPNYDAVQTRLQTFARAQAARGAVGEGIIIWEWSYMLTFLSEYYLLTNDAQVVPGILNFTLALSRAQSYYGTFGHERCVIWDDRGRLASQFYGPVNAVGGTAMIALALGRKALVAAGQTIAPEIDAAINRGTGFFGFCANKGSIPYGEHAPSAANHASNGKDAMVAIFFSLLPGREMETEYFSRMSIAGWIGREYGHTGQGLSYYWTALGALMGGPDAASEHLKQVRWHLDLSRRTDGSFAYDGREQFGPGTTSGNTYLGAAGYDGMSANATYLLTYSMPLKRLWITGKNANLAHTLDNTKIANAVAAGSHRLVVGSKTIPELFADIGEYDPCVRYYAAKELATRSLSGTDLTNLRNYLTSPNPNLRQSACQALGLLQDATALPTIVGMLNDSDVWVRYKAAEAIGSYEFTQAQADSHLVTMLNTFINKAANPNVIDWNDPIEMANGKLSHVLFGNAVDGYNHLAQYTVTATKPSPLYDAIRVGLRQPDSHPRLGVLGFVKNRLGVADAQALYPDLADTVKYEPPADRMWGADCRAEAISFITAMKITEGIPLALALLENKGYGSGAGSFQAPAFNGIASYGDAARYTLPILRDFLNSPTTALTNSITTIEDAVTAPVQAPGLCVASPQVVTTTGVKAITLDGSSTRGSFTFLNVTQPAHGTLSGTAPNLTYTPTPGYTGPDQFTFQTQDALTTSTIATVGIVVGPSGNGISGEYFNNANFTNSVLTRTDLQINFDWGSGSPHASISPDTFSTRWSGVLLVPETTLYTFSSLTSDGVRVYLNGQMIIDRFTDQNTHWTDSTPISLTAGQMVDITMEYYENTGNAVAKLKWTGPGFAGRNGDIIPQAYLFQGMSNRPCYAFGQNLSTTRNSALPLTLGGSSGSGGALSYHILSPPANGTLSGMAPNLTYTPNNNFAGTDSFTYLVNNGSSNSQPATILISVASGPLTSFSWSAAADGNWNDPARWTPAAPAAAGQANYALNFSPAGTYTATHNLNNGFLLNQLHFSGNTTLAGTQSIAFGANGGSLPRLVQNISGTVLINTPLALQSTVTLAGYGGGQVTLAGIVSGAGGIIKDSPGNLRISQNNNTYSGGTTLNMGRITMPSGPGSTSFALGTGPITLNSGTIIELDQSRLTNAMNLNGVTIENGNSFDSIFSGPVTLNNITLIDSYGGFEISGPISGSGGISSIHWSGEWRMSGSNTYTGPTTIEVGSIKYASAASVAPGPLVIISPGKANLNYSGDRVIASLSLGGVVMGPGTYGSSNQAAYFTGTGTVTVLPPTTCSINLTTGSSPAAPGTALTFTATVTGNAPTGNVSFYAGSTLLGTSALNGSFQATFATSSLAVGTHEITARYVGNASNATSTSAPLIIEIASNLPTTPVNLIAQPNNNQVRLLWTASSAATSYRVKRSITNGGPYTEIATCTTASYIDTTVTNGTTYYYVVAATNAFGNSGNSSQVSATPAIQSSNTYLSSSASTANQGAEVTFTAIVAGASITPTGTIVFKNGGALIGSSPLSGGMAFFTTTSLAVAGHIITAEYSGDTNYSASISAPCAYLVMSNVTTTGTTLIDLGTRVADGGTYFTSGVLHPKIPMGTLPPRSILRGVAWNVTLTKGDPYLGDLTVYFADSNGSNPVLQVGGVGPFVDGTAPYTAPIQLPWNAGSQYAIGTTVSTSLTAANGVPAFDLHDKAVFLETAWAGGWGGWISLTHDTPGPVPAKPLNLQAAPGNNQVSLTWSAASGAANYFVKRSLYAEGPFTVIANTSSTSFTDTSGIHGNTYYYVVSGINADGESIDSDSASASYSGTAYTVNYSANSATSGTAPSNQSKSHGVSLNLAYNVGNLVRTGFIFAGWNTQADGLGTDYAVASTYTANASVILYAKWIMTFDNWSSGSSFNTDSNSDGTHDGMAWLLGAANKETNATSRLPVASSSGGNLWVNFTCLKVVNRGSTTLKLQVSDDLGITDPWTNQEVVVPDSTGNINGILFTISSNADPNLINVQASIPNGSGSKVFARLMGSP